VVVAGLLTGREASPVARILDGMLRASVPFVVSEALLAEYHAVLARPKLRKLHGLTATDIDTLLTGLARHAIVLVPAKAAATPDPGDQLLWDKRLIQDPGMKGRVLTPRAFLAGS
jgi:predicted nucleic acid-binding protein